MKSIIPPSEFSHVGNPVFVGVVTDNKVNTILVDVYYQNKLVYVASVLANAATQTINIAEILQTIVNTPLPWPLPDKIVSPIVNWMAPYRLVVREMSGATAVSTWSSGTLYAVPGGIPDNTFLQLSAANTNIFYQRLLNSNANRFLTIFAGSSDNKIVLPADMSAPNRSSLLFFIARTGDSLTITVPDSGEEFFFPFVYPALYVLNLSAYAVPGAFVTARFSTGISVEIGFEMPVTSWRLRTWLFLNHFGVFETFITSGRATTKVSRPENTASRYVPGVDSFHTVDLPPAGGRGAAETITLSSGFYSPSYMQAFRHFSLSDWVYLISGTMLVYYFWKQASRLIADDDRQPLNNDIEAERSIREPVAAELGGEYVVANLINAQFNLISGQYNLITKKSI